MPAISVHHTAISEGAWDGPANEARLKSEEAPLRKSHAWVDSDGDPDAKAAYKFIHHEVAGDGAVGAANLTGCSTGIGVLNGGRGGTTIPDSDRKGVHAHLGAHLEDADRPVPPLRGEAAQVPDQPVAYPHIIRAFENHPWAILPEKLRDIAAFLSIKAAGGTAPWFQAVARPASRSAGAVAVLPLFGTITHRANMLTEFSGGTSTDKFTTQFRQALNDPNVRAIVIDVDSPGGEVMGTPELADEIFRARGQGKRIVAVANDWAVSGAYWIASAADELVVTPSGQVGSIGVFAAHVDTSAMEAKAGVKTTLIKAGRYKAELDGPLTDEARDAVQMMVDEAYAMFVKTVARNRGISANEVRNGFGEGRTVMAKAAKDMGMVDRIATLDDVLARFGANPANKAAMAEAPDPALLAGAIPVGLVTAEPPASEPTAEEIAPESPGPDGFDDDPETVELLRQLRMKRR